MRIRNILVYGLAIIITVALGLGSRSHIVTMPQFVTLYVGDALWATLVFWLVCIIKPGRKVTWQIFTALCFAYLIEFSQLYQAPWINQIRHTTIGGLVLGYGFRASDLIAYTIGVFLGALINQTIVTNYLKKH